MLRSPSFFLTLFGCAVISAGCSSQATDDYQGEPLAVVRGQITGASTASADAALLWSKLGGETLGSSTRVTVKGAFPQKFTLAIMDPPPDAAFSTTPWEAESKIAFADIAALTTGATPSSPSEVDAALVGGVTAHVVFYNQSPITSGMTLAKVFGTLDAGYHLLSVRAYTEEEKAAQSTCRDAATNAGKDAKLECPALKLHVESAPGEFAAEVELKLVPGASDIFPDLG